MNKWTREQRNQIILLAMGTVGVAALIWFGIISALQARLGAQADKMLVAQGNLNLIKAGISKEAQFKEEIELGKQDDGVNELRRLIQRYPRSNEALQARERLRKLGVSSTVRPGF